MRRVGDFDLLRMSGFVVAAAFVGVILGGRPSFPPHANENRLIDHRTCGPGTGNLPPVPRFPPSF